MYWQHRIKHLACGLHFIVCSDYEGWPKEGTTREQKVGEPTGVITCPECGGTTNFLHWKEQVQGFIFQAVPGGAQDMVLA
jgi:ssDNA-binding Zn-finger/Zn-ribbon topoisomerase 1